MAQDVEVFEHASRDWGSTIPHDILVEVFKNLSLQDIISGASRACRSWRRAAAESLFLCSLVRDLRPILGLGPVLNLGPILDLVEEADQRQYTRLLVTALNSQSPSRAPWQEIILPRLVTLLDDHLPYIAEKTPTLRGCARLRIRSTTHAMVISQALRHWPQLVICGASVHNEATHSFLTDLALCCKNMVGMQLYTHILSVHADVIVGGFPSLEALVLKGGAVSIEALRIVLDGCRRLKGLDIRHCIVFSNDDHGRGSYEMLDLTSDIFDRAAHLKFISCQWRTCEDCLRRVERHRQAQEN